MRNSPNINYTELTASHYPAINTAAVVTIAAGADDRWVLDRIWYSYDTTPTGGSLVVSFGGVTKLSLAIPAAGEGELLLDGFHNLTKNEAVVVTLASGGAGAIGKLTVKYR